MSQISNRTILAVASSPFKVMDYFDAATLEHVGRSPELVAEPHEIATDQGRGLLYLTHTYRAGGYQQGQESGHEISVLDPKRPEEVDVIDIHPYIAPHDIEYNAANDLIYASIEANEAGNGLAIIDPEQRKVVGHIATPGTNSHWVSVTPDGTKGYVTHKEGPMVSVIDMHRREVVRTIPLEGGAEEVDVAPDGSAVFVVTPQQTPPAAPKPGDRAKVIKIDTATDELVGELELDITVVAVRATEDLLLVTQMYPGGPEAVRQMYAGEGQGVPGQLHVIDAKSMKLLDTLEADRMAFTIRASADGKMAYVANVGAGTVSVYDLERRERIRTLECTPHPQFGGTHGLSLISI